MFIFTEKKPCATKDHIRWLSTTSEENIHYNCVIRTMSFLVPWVHLRKIEADTPPLVGLPQTKSTTSLFNSDMTFWVLVNTTRTLLWSNSSGSGEEVHSEQLASGRCVACSSLVVGWPVRSVQSTDVASATGRPGGWTASPQ